MAARSRVVSSTGTIRGEKRFHASAGVDLRPRTASHTVRASMPAKKVVPTKLKRDETMVPLKLDIIEYTEKLPDMSEFVRA